VRKATIWLFWLLIVVISQPAAAQIERAPHNKEQARQLIDLGSAALKRQDFAAALDYFQRAYARVPSANLRFNIAVALEKLGRDEEAAREFEAFLLEAAGTQADAQQYARERLGAIDARLAQISIRSSPGATIEIDGKVVGRAPLDRAIRVAPGKKIVRASKDGRDAVSERTVGKGERIEVDLAIAPPPERWIKRHKASVAVGAASLGVLAASASVGIASLVLKSELGCSSACPESARGRYDSMRATSIAADTLLGIGVAGAVVTIILYARESRRPKFTARLGH
jgi:hypothetical protein